MRIGLIFIISFFLFFQKGKAKNYFDVKSDSVVNELNLPDLAQESWSIAYQQWGKQYRSILKKNNSELSCAHCESVYINVIIEINKDGRLVSHQFVDGKQCGQKPTDLLINSFMKYWYTYLFPPELRNQKIQVRLGTGLKC